MYSRLGIFGGTYDPIHVGHLRAAEEVYEALELDKIVFIPAGHPPHKHHPDLSSFSTRYKMVSLAIQGVKHFEVSDIEKKIRPSYSVVTLKELRRRFPRADLFFILGLDAFLEFGSWYHYEELLCLAHLVVITRGPGGLYKFNRQVKNLFPLAQENKGIWQIPGAKSLRFLSITCFDISATMIRRRVRKGLSIRFLVPEKVRLFILEHRLYHKGSQKV